MKLASLITSAWSFCLAGGETECGNCEFPFTFNGWVHTTCTTVESDSEPWCSTQVDSRGNHVDGYWEYCSADCSGVTNPTPIIDDLNAPNNCFCGVPNTKSGGKIVGGSEVGIGEYPWQVSLLSSSNVYSHFCGGTLVSSKHVITAAHCTNNKTASGIFVSLGDTWKSVNNESESIIIPAKTIKQHPDYNNTDNDISVIELAETVDLLSNPFIKPICLPSAGKTYNGEKAVVSGWGKLDYGEPSPANLHGVMVDIYSDCGDMKDYMTESMICAGVSVNGGKDSCQGDSGGPLFVSDSDNGGGQTLAGVVSWGVGCAEAGLLGIYAETSHFSKWIDDAIVGGKICPAPREAPTTTPPPTMTTEEPKPDCWMDNKIIKLYSHQVKRKVKTVRDCADLCDQDDVCEFFTFKDHRRVRRRICSLKKIAYSYRKNFFSGPKNC